jgi:hypothetical protein
LKYKKNNWKALIGMRLNSNWSIEGQYTNLAADTFAYVDDSGTQQEASQSGKSFGVTGLLIELYLNQSIYPCFLLHGLM